MLVVGAVVGRWGAPRSWLYYDLVQTLQTDPRPYLSHPLDAERDLTRDERPPNASLYLDALALEGFTMTTTFVSLTPYLPREPAVHRLLRPSFSPHCLSV